VSEPRESVPGAVSEVIVIAHAAKVWQPMAIRLRRLIRGEMFLILAGIVAVLAGLTILIWPAPAVLVLTWVLGICALVVGILLVVAAVRIRGLARGRRTRFGSGPTVAKAHPHSP
jgi:uncharacterized membrane protein HdeD (DUF308 family)